MKKKAKETKKMSKKNKSIIIIVVLCICILGLSFVLGRSILSHSNKKKDMMSYEEAKDKSKEIALSRQKLKEIEEKQKEENGENNEYSPEKSDLYKEYEKLSDEEKEGIDAIPREDEIPPEVIDEIIEDQEEVEIPEKFSLKDVIDIKVENQGFLSLCWGFASMNSLETYLALHENKTYDFSEQHLNYITSNLLYGYRAINEGGNFSDFKNYLIQSGVVLEESVPYNKTYSEEEYSKFINMEPVKIVTETVSFPKINKYSRYESDTVSTEEETEKIRNAIKRHIMKNGSLYAVTDIDSCVYSHEYCYRSKDYDGLKMINHAISIVGWDDTIPKEKFLEEGGHVPEHDGAYIILNSYGEYYTDSTGEMTGYYYISYDDIFIESEVSGIISVEFNESTALDLESIKSSSIKNDIYKKYYYGLKDYNNKKYITKLLNDKITTLSLNNDKNIDLEELSFFKNLLSLEINDCDLKTIDNLPVMENLMSIKLENNELENIDHLSDFKKLNGIYAKNNNIKDVSKLSNLQLNYVDFSKNKSIKGYGKLISNNIILSDDEISELEKFNEEEPVQTNVSSKSSQIGTSRYDRIDLSNNKLTSIDNLPKSLEILDVSNNQITDFSIINSFPNILSLTVNNSNITDLSLFNNINVYNLYLSNNKISNIDNFIPGSKLRFLELDNNLIESIDAFNPSDSLRTISLKNNKIKDVSNFKTNKLDNINLSGNKDVKGFENLEVKTLNVSNCNIDKIDSIASTVFEIDISDNNLKEINFLNSIDYFYSISLRNNNGVIKGELNTKAYSLLIDNTKFSDDFSFKGNIQSINVSNINDLKLFNNVNYISIVNTDLSENEFYDVLNSNPSSGINIQNGNVVFEINKSGNIIDISNSPINLIDYYKYVNTDGVAISRDRKHLLLIDDSIDMIDTGYNVSIINDRFVSFNGKIKVTKSKGLFGSLINGYKYIISVIVHTFSSLV